MSLAPFWANNQLVFRGINNTTVPSAALTATATQITVRVPPLAETGPITLTNSRGTVLSPVFTVTREQDFQLVVSPASLTVYQGASSTAQAQLSSTGTRQFTGLVTLSVQGLPAGGTASFSPAATISAFQTGAITLGASGSAAPGSYNVTAQASFTEGGVPFVRSASLNLTVAPSANVTGVKGRFVTPEGQGIAGVIVRAELTTGPQPETTTDAAGNFVLVGLAAGPITLRFDATPVNPINPKWGYTTMLVANQIVVIAEWTITPPPPAERFTTINNATQDQIITDPRYPGLEITLPAGVTIVGWDGVPKTRLAVERLDPDKLPISAPPIPTNSVYQIFWGTPMGGIPSGGQVVPVTLPNDLNLEPGEKTELWYYDAPPTGGEGVWKTAGLGTVSADGKTIKTDPGVGIPRFCGVCGMPCFVNNQNNNPPPPPPGPCCPPDQNTPNRVNLATGLELPRAADLTIGGLIPLELAREFHPRDPYANIAGTTLSLGLNWALSYDATLLPINSQLTRIILAGNNRVDFTPDGAGAFQANHDPRFYGAKLRNVSGGWEVTYKDGQVWRFDPFGGLGVHYLTAQRDTNGNSLIVTRSGTGKIQSVQGGQRSLSFTSGGNGFVSQVDDNLGRTVKYAYNAQNVLETVTLPDNETIRYTYVNDSEFPNFPACSPVPGGTRIKTIKMPGQTALQELHYGSGKRVLREVLPNGEELRFRYAVTGACVTHISNPAVQCSGPQCPTEDSWENFQAGWRFVGGTISAATMVDGKGRASTQRFGPSRVASGQTNNQGQTTKYVRDAQNRLLSMTDALGRTWRYSYDSNGNRIQEIDPLNRVTDTTYDTKWNKPTSITRYLDGRPIVSRFEYDPNTGNLLKSFDRLNHETRFTYTAQGQRATVRDVALDQTTTFEYNTAGDLILTRDSVGSETMMTVDGVGRATRTTDPLGFETLTEYSNLDQVTKITDANQGLTQFEFDLKRDLRSVTNPLNRVIEAYQYDAQHRLVKKTDAKLKEGLYTYDANGNLETVRDRKGQLASFVYDEQNRIARIDYVGGVSQNRSYDATGRLVEIREPGSAIAYGYDAADRIVKEATDAAAGRTEVLYEYDNLDRRTKRTVLVNGTLAEETTYGYDDAGRLLTQTHRALGVGQSAPQSVTYIWDDGNRLTQKTLPNGIRQVFSHDGANRVTQIQYRNPDDTVIETIAYTYDARGQRLTKTIGSSGVRDTALTAGYDEANRMTSLTLTGTGQSFLLTYDENGNLIQKTEQGGAGAITAYSWDSRNRLTGISAPGITASFSYDGFGRRISKTVNGQTVAYAYDGRQAVGEITNGQLSATLLTGLSVDEVIARFTTQGTRSYLTDALNSVLIQAKDDRSIQNSYPYSPYGEVSILGPDEGNPIQYAGRENDGTGLYYYRARYYDPVLKRFISEDPIELQGGLNMYSYVGGAPTNLLDPYGLTASCMPGVKCWPNELPPTDRIPPKDPPRPKMPGKDPGFCAKYESLFAACHGCCIRNMPQVATACIEELYAQESTLS